MTQRIHRYCVAILLALAIVSLTYSQTREEKRLVRTIDKIVNDTLSPKLWSIILSRSDLFHSPQDSLSRRVGEKPTGNQTNEFICIFVETGSGSVPIRLARKDTIVIPGTIYRLGRRYDIYVTIIDVYDFARWDSLNTQEDATGFKRLQTLLSLRGGKIIKPDISRSQSNEKAVIVNNQNIVESASLNGYHRFPPEWLDVVIASLSNTCLLLNSLWMLDTTIMSQDHQRKIQSAITMVNKDSLQLRNRLEEALARISCARNDSTFVKFSTSFLKQFKTDLGRAGIKDAQDFVAAEKILAAQNNLDKFQRDFGALSNGSNIDTLSAIVRHADAAHQNSLTEYLDILRDRKSKRSFLYVSRSLLQETKYLLQDYVSGIAKNRNIPPRSAVNSAKWSWDISVPLSYYPSVISLSHTDLHSGHALGIAGFGFEVGLGDRVLNLLAYQAPYLNVGGRFLFDLSGGASSRLEDSATFVDMKILGHIPINAYRIVKNTERFQPFVSLGDPKLNTPLGIACDLSTSRLFSQAWPQVNLYGSSGFGNFVKPSIVLKDINGDYSYFSDIQLEGSMSFYWNADYFQFNRFRLDLGFGTYDIWRVYYDTAGTVLHSDNLVDFRTKLLPLISLSYTFHSPTARFGLGVRCFDNRFNCSAWIKMYEWDDSTELRLEAKYETEAYGRGEEPWETKGGSIVQLRLRHGF